MRHAESLEASRKRGEIECEKGTKGVRGGGKRRNEKRRLFAKKKKKRFMS